MGFCWRLCRIFEDLQVDRSLIEVDDRNPIFERSRQVHDELGLEPMELLIAAVSMILVTDSQLRDTMGFVDVSESENGDGDAPQLLNELRPFPHCKMLILDEELLAGDALDLRCTQPPAAKFWLLLLERDGFYNTSSIVLAEELPDGALRTMY